MREAFVDYLTASGRLHALKTDAPLWTRHTFARIVPEVAGDITATQNALDHQNRSTTRVYVQRIAVKRDLYSGEVSKRWEK